MTSDSTNTTSAHSTDDATFNPATWLQHFEQNGGYWIVAGGRVTLGWYLDGDEAAEQQALLLFSELKQDPAKNAAVKEYLVSRAGEGVTMSADISDNDQCAGTANDDALEDAWTSHRAAMDALEAMDPDLLGCETDEENEIWSRVDAAQAFILDTAAKTPRGAEIKLWVALHHLAGRREDHDAIRRGDVAALDGGEKGMDWNARLVFSAIKSLRNMEA